MTRLRGRASRPRHARYQRLLAVAAIATAVALPVVLISVGGGVSDHELAALESSGYQIVVNAAGVHGIAHAHRLADRIRGIPGVTYASPVLSVAIDAFSGSSSLTPVLAEGVVPSQFLATLGPTEGGIFPDPLPLGDPSDATHFANGTYDGPATDEVIVSSPYASAFGVSSGATIGLAASDNASEAVPFSVTGTFVPASSFLTPTAAYVVVLPLSDLQLLTGYANGTGTIVPDAADSVEVAVNGTVASHPDALDRVAAEVAALAPLYSVSTLSQQAAEVASGSAILTGFYLALSSVGIVVGVVFLTLVLLRRVDQERRSIGIRRALGLSAATVASGIVGDGLAIASVGSVAGVTAGYVLVELLAAYGRSTVQEAARLAVFSPTTLAEIALGVVALSLLASGVATRAALRLPLAEALR